MFRYCLFLLPTVTCLLLFPIAIAYFHCLLLLPISMQLICFNATFCFILTFFYDTTFGVVFRIAGNLPHGGHASTQSRCVIASLAQQVVQDIDLQGEPSCRGTACSSCRQLGTPCVHPKPTRDTRLS